MVQSSQSPTAPLFQLFNEKSHSGVETFQSGSNEAVIRALAHRHVVTALAFGKSESGNTSHSPLGASNSAAGTSCVNFAPWPMPVRRAATLHALQEWEGYVVGIGDDDFVVQLVDLTAGGSQESEEAVIPLAEISERDASRMVVGSIFRWVIGYERSVEGTRRRVSRIVFRDLLRMTDGDFRKGRDWMQSVASAFDQ